jgi:hypothetical protein
MGKIWLVVYYGDRSRSSIFMGRQRAVETWTYSYRVADIADVDVILTLLST